MAVCPSPSKAVPDSCAAQEIYEENRELDLECRCDLVKERGKEGKLGGRKHLILQCNSEKVQQGPEGYLSQITGLSQESSTFQAWASCAWSWAASSPRKLTLALTDECQRTDFRAQHLGQGKHGSMR